MTDLIPHQGAVMPTAGEIDTAVRIAANLAKSGMFKDARQAEQAFAKIMLGRDLGLSPTQAMTSIHVVEGKPELSANLQAQLVKTYRGPDGERYDYRVLKGTSDECSIEFRRKDPGGPWEVLGVETFTMDDARTAGLAGRGPWKTYPRNMLWARAMSNGVNFHCPEVARGLRVYHEGEIDTGATDPAFAPTTAQGVHQTVNEDRPVDVDEHGEVIDAQVVPDDQPAQPTAREPEQTVNVASAAQRKLLHARKKQWGLTDDQLRQALTTVAGSPHTDRLPKDKVDDVLAELERMAAEQAAGVAA